MADDSTFSIEDLCARPEFSATVADRIWRAWWREQGEALATIAGLVANSLEAGRIPTTLVALRGDAFLGTTSVITCDQNLRAHLTPWVAAVWVEPHARRMGVGGALVAAAADFAFDSGADFVYLCALPAMRAFYEERGWSLLEENVGDAALMVFKRANSRQPQGS